MTKSVFKDNNIVRKNNVQSEEFKTKIDVNYRDVL